MTQKNVYNMSKLGFISRHYAVMRTQGTRDVKNLTWVWQFSECLWNRKKPDDVREAKALCLGLPCITYFLGTKKSTAKPNKCNTNVTLAHRAYYASDIFTNGGFARQPCCMAGTIDSFSYGKKCSFWCKTFSLFLPCNMAAVQNLYSQVKSSLFRQGSPISHRLISKGALRKIKTKNTIRSDSIWPDLTLINNYVSWFTTCLPILGKRALGSPVFSDVRVAFSPGVSSWWKSILIDWHQNSMKAQFWNGPPIYRFRPA